MSITKGRQDNSAQRFENTVVPMSGTQGILIKQDEIIDKLNSVGDILTFTSSAGSGGAATEVMTLTGILATDTILAVSQSVDGAANLPLLGFNTLANDALTGVWSADPLAGAIIVVSVARAKTTATSIAKVDLK